MTADRPARPSAIGSTPSRARLGAQVVDLRQPVGGGLGRAQGLVDHPPPPAPGVARPAPGRPGRHVAARRPRPCRAGACSAPCGCCSSTCAQASSARPSSRPGRTTRPAAGRRWRSAGRRWPGRVPVEPAAISTPCGGSLAPLLAPGACSSSHAAGGDVGQAQLGQPLRPGGEHGLAGSRAETCQCRARSPSTRVVEPAASVDLLDLQAVEEGAQRRRPSPAPAGGVETAAEQVALLGDQARQFEAPPPGRDRPAAGPAPGRPARTAARPRRGRPARGSAAAAGPAPPAAATKASARARAPRRVGVRTDGLRPGRRVARRPAPTRPRARSSRKGRWAGMLNQRGPGLSREARAGHRQPRFGRVAARRDRRRASRSRPSPRRTGGPRPASRFQIGTIEKAPSGPAVDDLRLDDLHADVGVGRQRSAAPRMGQPPVGVA